MKCRSKQFVRPFDWSSYLCNDLVPRARTSSRRLTLGWGIGARCLYHFEETKHNEAHQPVRDLEHDGRNVVQVVIQHHGEDYNNFKHYKNVKNTKK